MNRTETGQITIRKAVPDDAENLSRLGRITFSEAFGDTNTEEDLGNYLEKSFNVDGIRLQLEGPDIFHLAEMDGESVGYLKLNISAKVPEVDGLNAIQLERIYIRKHLYGKGLGNMLLEVAVSEARDLGYDQIWLGVWQENKRAIDFYLKNNFKIVGNKLFRIGDNITKDFVMLLKI